MSSLCHMCGVLHTLYIHGTFKIKTVYYTFGSYLGMITWVVYGMAS